MNFWERVGATIASEFSDIDGLESMTRVAVRMVLAAVLGALLGMEREHAGKAAGLRTHMLVALGAALFVLVPLQAGADDESISRVVQGLLAGIGFLCAGTIVKTRDEDRVQGLTTAAGLWLTAAIGVAVGLGRETTAVFSAVFALAILGLERPLSRWLDHRRSRAPKD